MNILVTGANGQLGSELQVLAKGLTQYNWCFTDVEEMDITSEESLLENFNTFKPNVLINAAAYTAVDKAEEDSDTAYLINAEAVKHITNICNTNDCFLVHVSSDYVYHNNPGRPLLETDPTLGEGVYAKSKLKGDQHAIALANSYVIVRTSWVYSSFGNNFVKTMMRLGNDRDALSIVSDQIGTPSYAADIASAIMHIIDYKSEHKTEDINGVYNFSNSGVTNWAEFAESIFKKCQLNVAVTPITTEDFGAPAPRPKWSLMNKEKIRERFDLKLIPWEDSLYKCIDLLNAKAE